MERKRSKSGNRCPISYFQNKSGTIIKPKKVPIETRSTRPFKPSVIPSPIYGFKERPEKDETTLQMEYKKSGKEKDASSIHEEKQGIQKPFFDPSTIVMVKEDPMNRKVEEGQEISPFQKDEMEAIVAPNRMPMLEEVPEVEEIAVDPEEVPEAEEIAADPEEVLEAEEVAVDPEEVPEAEEIAADPEEVLEAEEVAVDPEEVSEAEEIAVEPEKALEAEEIVEDPEEVLEAEEIAIEAEEVPEVEEIAVDPEEVPETEEIAEDPEEVLEAEEIAIDPEEVPEVEEIAEDPEEVPVAVEPIKEQEEEPTLRKSPIPFNVIMLNHDKRKLPKQRMNPSILSVVEQTESTQPTLVEPEKDLNYEFPPFQLLTPPAIVEENGNWIEELKDILDKTLENFNVGARVVNVTQGPSVTRFEVQPEPGVKVNKITNLSDDIKLSLAARDIRMEAPIPGNHTIGIEVPNEKSACIHQ